MKKKLAFFLSVAMVASLFAACSRETGGDSVQKTTNGNSTDENLAAEGEAVEGKENSAGASKVYGISVMTHNNPFFFAEVEGVKEAVALDEGAEVIAPDPANDITKQVQQISELIARGVDVLIIDPIDSEGIEPALVEADKAGIPVVNIDSICANRDLLDCFIVSDNVDAGMQAGRMLCEAIGKEGEIAIVNWSALKAVRDRTDGLKKVIEEEYPNVKIVQDQDAYGKVEDAQNITDTFMQSNPNLKGIFAINDPTAQGVVSAIQGANKTGKILVVSVDGSQNGIDMIKDGQLLCSPVQQPYEIGKKAVEISKAIWQKQSIEKEIIIPIINITSDNWEEWDGKTY